MLQRKVIVKTSPDIVVTVDGNKYKVETITSLKTMVVEFTLGSPYETDPGTGTVGKYVTSLEGDSLVTKDAGSGKVVAKREFTDAGMTMYAYADGVTATRVFKRA